MGLLIDCFNLMYKIPSLEDKMKTNQLASAQEGLVALLLKYQKIKDTKICLIFDGKKNPGDPIQRESRGRLELIYSQDVKADEIIKKIIKEDKNPKMTTVVTSDNEIIFYAKRYQAQIIKSEDFAEQLLRAIADADTVKETEEKNENTHLSEDDIAEWQNYFRSKKQLNPPRI